MARKLEVEIVGDASSLHRALGKADSSSKSFGSSLGKLGKAAAFTAGGAGLGALAVGLKIGIDEYSQSQKVAAQTNAVIKSTGGVANVTAKHVSDLATRIMRKTGIDDEQVASSENMLLTFKNVRNELGKGNRIFDQATGLVQDMSVAFGIDGSKAAIQLGKALNDPEKGLTALQRIGVTFTKGQKDQIKALVDSGQTMKAQKIILGELRSEVGGSAEAFGKTLPGQIAIAKQSFNNFAGDLVAKTIPVLEKTIGWLRDHWPEIRKQIDSFWAAVRPTFVQFGQIVAEVAGLIRKHWGTIGPILTTVANIVKVNLKIMGDALKILAAILRGDWSAAWRAVKQLVGDVTEAIKQRLILFKQTVGALAVGIGKAIKNGVVDGLEGIGGAAWNMIRNIGAVIAQKAGAIAGWGIDVGRHLISGIVSGLSSLPGRIVALIKAAVNAVIDRINRALEFHVGVKVLGRKVGVDFNAPDIPHLAGGGVVSSPTMALLGERGPEAVVPLGRGGGLGTIVVPLVVDGTELARVLIDPLRGQAQMFKQRTGRQAFA